MCATCKMGHSVGVLSPAKGGSWRSDTATSEDGRSDSAGYGVAARVGTSPLPEMSKCSSLRAGGGR